MRKRLGGGAAAMAAAVVMAGPAQAGPMKLERLTAVSGTTPFSACPFDAPPPFTENEWQPQDTAVEPHIAIDPKHPDRMAAAWMQDFTQGIVVAHTEDGGRTWARSVPPGLSKCTGHDGASADPRLAYGADGTLWMSSMRAISLSPARTVPDNQVAVSASADGGRTWGDPIVVQDGPGYNDFPGIAADPHDAGKVYVTFTRATEPVGNALLTMISRLRKGADGRLSFTAPEPVYRATDPAVYYAAGSLVAQPGGRVLLLLWMYDGLNYLPTPDVSTSKIRALTSSDGGVSWSDPVIVGEQGPVYNATDPESGETLRSGTPHAAPARDGGWLVAWHDIDGSQGRMRLARGRADGSWEAPREILPWAERQIFFPMVAQAPDGTLGFMWYDSRHDGPQDGRYLIDAYFAASRDGDRTLSELHLAGPMDLRTGWADARTFSGVGQRFLGDYAGMVAGPRGFAGALPLTAPAGSVGKSQLFVAQVKEQGPAKKRKRKRRRR